jgi:hypothetical protein
MVPTNADITVEEYLSNDSLNILEVTFKIVKKYYETLPINEFLDIIFKYRKTQLFLEQNKGLATACYLKSRRIAQEIFDGFFIDAPIHIKSMYENRLNNLDNMIQINRYIGSTFREDPKLGIMNDLEYYTRKLNIMTKEYRKTLNYTCV